MSHAYRIGLVVAVAAVLAGCSTLQTLGIVRDDTPGGSQNASAEGAPAPDERARIPVIALDQQLKVADTLKGASITLPAAVRRDDWPLPGGTPEQSIEHVDAAAEFKIAWRARIGGGSTRYQHITAPPVIGAGRVYTMDAGANVVATDALTGRTVWRGNFVPETLPDGTKPKRWLPAIYYGDSVVDSIAFGGGVAFADGKVFIASGYRFVAAVDANTGQLLWRTFVDTPIHSAPTVANGRVFAVTTDNELVSFDANTGQAGWTHQGLVEPARILQASSPAVLGETVVAAFSSGEVTALRAANGTELWPANLSRVSRTTALAEIRDIAGRPVIYKGDVYAASHSGVFSAIDFRTGQPRWELPIISIATPWAVGDVVYIVSKAGEVICVSRATGEVYWIRDLNEGRRGSRTTRWLGREVADRAYWTGVMLASGRLVTMSSDGRAATLNPQTGDVLGYVKLPGPVLMTPIAANGMIYVVTDKGQLVAIR